MKKIFKLFANCYPVKGFNRSMIIDFERNDFTFIPNSLYHILTTKDSIDLEDLETEYPDSTKTVRNFFNLLIKNEYIFETNLVENKNFLKKDITYHTPYQVTNVIIDIDKNSTFPVINIKKSFENLGVQALQIRCYDLNIKKITEILNTLNSDSRLRFIEIYIPYKINVEKICQNLIKKYERIYQIIVFNSPNNFKIDNENVIFINKKIKNCLSCGIIEHFNISFEQYIESLQHNSCLNKKISIDKNGDIKNCPSMFNNFGNIRDTTLEEALNKEYFKKYWNISKNDIEICKDCEFRHICVDCRAYIEDPNNDLSKPLKCGYNPYTNEWEEWSRNPLKQKTINFYGLEKISTK